MVARHLDATLSANSLTNEALGARHSDDADAHLLHLLHGLEHLGGGARLRSGEHDGLLSHALVARNVPLGSMDEIDLKILVAELVHEVLELHKLVPGATNAHQEDGVVTLVGDLIGHGGHLLARLVERLTVLEIPLLVEVHDLNFFRLCHERSFLVSSSEQAVIHRMRRVATCFLALLAMRWLMTRYQTGHMTL